MSKIRLVASADLSLERYARVTFHYVRGDNVFDELLDRPSISIPCDDFNHAQIVMAAFNRETLEGEPLMAHLAGEVSKDSD